MVEKRTIRQKIYQIVGESRESRSGTPRQALLTACNPGDEVELRRDPENQYDPNAILVIWQGEDIGFLPRETAEILAPELDATRVHRAQIHRIKGGVPGYPTYGAEISVAWDGKACPSCHPLDEAQLKSRKGKLAAAGRKRDSSGAFAKANKQGCSLVVVAILVPFFGVAATCF